MLKKMLKWSIVPVLTVTIVTGLSSFINPNEQGGGGKQEATQTKTETVTWTWNASLKIWQIGGSGTQTKTETKTTVYKCCMGGGSTCTGIDC